MLQRKAAPKRAEKTTMAAPKGATEKRFRHLCRTKCIDVQEFKEQTEHQQTVELTTFRTQASSGRRNGRYYQKSHEFMKK